MNLTLCEAYEVGFCLKPTLQSQQSQESQQQQLPLKSATSHTCLEVTFHAKADAGDWAVHSDKRESNPLYLMSIGQYSLHVQHDLMNAAGLLANPLWTLFRYMHKRATF